MTRYLLTASAALMIGGTPAFGQSAVPYCGADAAAMPPPRPYVAVRRLEARTEKNGKHAWMDVRTTLTRDGRFTYEVLQEGGSEQIRERALYAALKREQESAERGAAMHMPAVLAEYQCAMPEPDANGLMRVSIRPREPSRHLVNGTLLMEPQSGAVVRIAGRLSKSPSFWVSEVLMDWTYGRLAGAVLPTSVHARAKVKFVGPATFDMTYRYISVDGQPVATGAVTAGAEDRK
jgi:hypothetical protein